MPGYSRVIRMLDRIRSNIAAAGHHVTLVKGGENPKFAYTVGLTETRLPELVLAGATSLTRQQVGRALDAGVAASRDGSVRRGSTLHVEGVGQFELTAVDPSWTRELLLGALHYYRRNDVPALQLVPEESLRTIDVPNLSVPFDPEREPVWRWLIDEWPFEISSDTFVMTNLDALHGHAVTEAGRWEKDHWELFSGAGTDVAEKDARAVPLATLLAYDPTLEPVTRLEVGQGLWRKYMGPWQVWE